MNNESNNDRTRLWLLFWKLFGVAVYFGGLCAVVFIWMTSNFTALDLNDPRRLFLINQISRLMIFLVVPGLLLAIAIGIVLTMRKPGYFLRARWLQVEIVSLLIFIPCAHFFCSSRLSELRMALDPQTSATLARQFSWGISAGLIGSIWLVLVCRIKPRFGQSESAAGKIRP